MSVLKGLSWLIVSVDVQAGVSCESFPFKHCGVEESSFVRGEERVTSLRTSA